MMTLQESQVMSTAIAFVVSTIAVSGLAAVLIWLCHCETVEDEYDVPEDEGGCERCGLPPWSCVCTDPPGGEG